MLDTYTPGGGSGVAVGASVGETASVGVLSTITGTVASAVAVS
jgi:hypothetical protein